MDSYISSKCQIHELYESNELMLKVFIFTPIKPMSLTIVNDPNELSCLGVKPRPIFYQDEL